MKPMLSLAGLLMLWLAPPLHATERPPSGKVVEARLVSTHLKGNLIGIDPKRTLKVYLPPGYEGSHRAYPVIYYFHSIFWSNRRMFEDGNVQRMLDRAIADGTIGEVIVVAGDFSTPHIGTFFGNTEATGRWLDHVVDELVPFVDAHFRTMPDRRSRGLAGDYLGGYAALKLAMLHPDDFSAVYALHPIGTAPGLVPMAARPDWRKMNLARSWNDLDGDGTAQVFMAMSQAYLPNPDRPPFYCDLIVKLEDDKLTFDASRAAKLQSAFLLDQLVPRYVDNLKRLTAVQLDWGRYDLIQDHVAANQAFSRKLDEHGIEHFAEEYRGNQHDQIWIEHGRVQDRLLPFFSRHLTFSAPQ